MDVIIKIVSNNIFPPEGKILVEFLIEKLSENTSYFNSNRTI